MGFVAESGALATVNNISSASSMATEESKSVYARRGSAYGFSCFVYLCASLIGIAMAIYISPDTGSEMEKGILTHPRNVIVDESDVEYPRAAGAGGSYYGAEGEDLVPDYSVDDGGF